MTKEQRAKLDAVEAKSFLYDDCHKIFLCADEADEDYARRKGWEDEDFREFDRDLIEKLYDDACPLRAIWWMDEYMTREDVIPQEF